MRTSVLIILALTLTCVVSVFRRATKKATVLQSGSGSGNFIGCFLDASTRVLPSNFQSNSAMTVEMCATQCQGYTYYGVEDGNQCFCGNTLPTQTSTACTMPCAGNSKETCGGFWAISVYSASAYQSFGCFVDNSNRVLPSNFQSSGSMTVEQCANQCAGYAYFGVEYGDQCFCGNTLPTQTSTACNYPCAGNSKETCGGFWAVNVYRTPSVYQTLGCFTDNSNRVLPSNFQSSGSMTVEQCANQCAGYTYFGVEDGNQCFCGNTVPTQTSTACTYPCAGNSKETCGGSWAINVYHVPSAFQSLGCFVDAPNRVLPSNFQSSTTMTVEQCANQCAGYTYFGVEDGNQCFCGNTVPTQTSTACTYPCAGNSKETCGGYWAVNVYKYGKSLGCFADNSNRALPSNFQSSGSMTVEQCANQCIGYAYYGVEYGNQCFCGNNLPTQTSTGCNYPCAGNSKETCGGSWAINVYQY